MLDNNRTKQMGDYKSTIELKKKLNWMIIQLSEQKKRPENIREESNISTL